MKIPAFLREPAWWMHTAAVAAVVLLTVFPRLTTEQQGWWDGVIAAVAGLAISLITRDGIFAAAAGLIKGALMVMLGYHWMPVVGPVGPVQMAAIFTLLSGLLAAYTRTQAVAPLGPEDATVGTTVPPAQPTVPAVPPLAPPAQ